jgi:hypothetical protein
MRVKVWMSVVAIGGSLALGCGGNKDQSMWGGVGTSGSNAPSMSLTGCVQEGTPAGTYVLKTIGPPEGPRSGTAGTSGGQSAGGSQSTPLGAGGSRNAGQSYRLIASGNLDLGQNLGKEVKVTGQLANQAPDTTGTSGATRERQGSAGASGEGAVGTRPDRQAPQATGGADAFFRVTEVTKVGDRCGGSRN